MSDYDLLGIKVPVTVSELKARWKELAAQHHPDRGGDLATFIELKEAYERLLPRCHHCLKCRDTGVAHLHVGFQTLRSVCECRLKKG